MYERARSAQGLEVTILDPPMYQRLIHGVVNVTMVPLSWLFAVVDPSNVLSRERSPYRVVVRNQRGEERTIALTTDFNDAERKRDETVQRLDSLGVDAWGHEMRNRIPASFFSPST